MVEVKQQLFWANQRTWLSIVVNFFQLFFLPTNHISRLIYQISNVTPRAIGVTSFRLKRRTFYVPMKCLRYVKRYVFWRFTSNKQKQIYSWWKITINTTKNKLIYHLITGQKMFLEKRFRCICNFKNLPLFSLKYNIYIVLLHNIMFVNM